MHEHHAARASAIDTATPRTTLTKNRTNREACVDQTGHLNRAFGRRDGTTKAEEYRAKARECEELAEQTRDSFIKEQFLEVAKKWRQMAEHEDNR